MAAQNDDSQRNGVLLGDFPPINEIYDRESGRAMLIPGLPLPPSAPGEDAIRMGIIDSGVMADHPQLTTLIVAEKAFAGSETVDRIGHGTLVALQSVRNHADPEIQKLLGDKFSYPAIVSARVTDDFGVPNVDAVIAAVDWIASQRVKVANLSLGFLGEADEYTDLCEAIARHPDIFFTAAAGNFGPEVKVYPSACSIKNLMSIGEVRGGVPAESSGQGQIYAPTDLPFFTFWEYYLDLGNQAAQERDFSKARENYHRSIEAENNVGALFQLGLLDIYDNDLASAEGYLVSALGLEPTLAILHAHLGIVRFMEGRFEEAEIHLRKALELDTGDQMAAFNLGQTLLNLNRPREAMDFFEQLRNRNPDYPRLNDAIAAATARLDSELQE